MSDQIATITIPCVVIALNTTQFYDTDGYGSIGKVLQVPCRSVLYDNTEAWAVPQSDSGIFTGFTFIHKAGDYVTKPTVDSFTVCRITDKLSENWWWVYGTYADFLASCATCCGSSPVAMPTPSTLKIAPCNELCTTDADGNYFEIIGVQDTSPEGNYYPFGSYNGVAAPSANPAGYTGKMALLTYLNSSWSSIGSPAVSITWTSVAGGIKATFTSGATLADVFCMSVVVV